MNKKIKTKKLHSISNIFIPGLEIAFILMIDIMSNYTDA